MKVRFFHDPPTMICKFNKHPDFDKVRDFCVDLRHTLGISQISVQGNSVDAKWECSSGPVFANLIRGERTLENGYREELKFTSILSELKGTVVEEFLDSLPVPVYRARILTLAPGGKYSFHRDPSPRIHLPLTSNSRAFFQLEGRAVHLPADGSIYYTDTRLEHTAYNNGDVGRIHLVAVINNDDISTLLQKPHTII